MGLPDVNEDSYIFIYSNSEITNLETSFQLCKKPQKKNFTCASFPPGGFPPNKSKAEKQKMGKFLAPLLDFFFRLPRCQSYSPTRNLHQCLDGALPIQATRNGSEQGQHTFVCLFVLGRRRRRSMKGIVLVVVVAILL